MDALGLLEDYIHRRIRDERVIRDHEDLLVHDDVCGYCSWIYVVNWSSMRFSRFKIQVLTPPGVFYRLLSGIPGRYVFDLINKMFTLESPFL